MFFRKITVSENGQEATIKIASKTCFFVWNPKKLEKLKFSSSPHKLNFAIFSHPQEPRCINNILWEVILKNSVSTYWKKKASWKTGVMQGQDKHRMTLL